MRAKPSLSRQALAHAVQRQLPVQIGLCDNRRTVGGTIFVRRTLNHHVGHKNHLFRRAGSTEPYRSYLHHMLSFGRFDVKHCTGWVVSENLGRARDDGSWD